MRLATPVGLLIAFGGCGRIGFDLLAPADGQIGVSDAPSGLIALYPFDEPDATTFHDVVGGHDGSCAAPGCPVPTAGHIGGGFAFDGFDDCITVPDVGQLRLATLTIALWSYQNGSVWSSPIAKPYMGDPDSWQLETEHPSIVDSLTFSTATVVGGNDFLSTAGGARTNAAWHLLAVTWDGTTKRVNIDGIERASNTPGGALLYDSSPMLIGCDNNSGTLVLGFSGVLDSVAIYDRALDPGELAQLAAQ